MTILQPLVNGQFRQYILKLMGNSKKKKNGLKVSLHREPNTYKGEMEGWGTPTNW